MRTKTLFLSALVFLGACPSKPTEEVPAKKVDATVTTPTKKEDPPTKENPKGETPKKKIEKAETNTDMKPKPLDETDKKKRKEFMAAMNKGRKATVAKEYSDAFSAFDEALTILKDNPQALAERGYAKLLAKDYDSAEKDLLAAREKTPKPKLEGQIWYNLGLVEEGRGNLEDAQLAFAKANLLNPSKAAANKLSGKSVCTAKIERAPVEGQVYTDWLSAFQDLTKEMDKDSLRLEEIPTTNELAKAILCGECSATKPLVRDIGEEYAWTYIASFMLPDGRPLIFTGLGEAMMGRCGWDDEVTLDPQNPLHVSVLSEPQDMEYVEAVDNQDGTVDIAPCGDGSDECMTACFIGSSTRTDYFFDVSKKSQVLSIERYQSRGAKGDWLTDINLTTDKSSATLKGGSCDETITISTP
jgi:hypothetical protein